MNLWKVQRLIRLFSGISQPEITYSELKIETKRQWHRFSGFIVNFEHILHLCSSVSIANFEHVIAGWVLDCNYVRLYRIFRTT